MLGRRATVTGRLARAAALPLQSALNLLRGDGIDDMTRNGEQRVARAVLGQAGPSPTVLDVGANVGLWTQWVTGEVPGATVHAFEPDPRAHAELERATAGLANVHRHRLALGAEPGTATLYGAGDITP